MDEKDIRRAGKAAEELDEIARESYKAAVDRAFEAQKSGLRLSRRFFENWVETLEDQAELNRRTMQGLTQLVREQREVFHPPLPFLDAVHHAVEPAGAFAARRALAARLLVIKV